MRRFLLCYALISLSAVCYCQIDLTQGLVAYYPFNGNTVDVSGNGNNGLLHNGAKLTEDRFGVANSAYYFDGIDDYIQIPNSSTLNQSQAMSVVVYFYPEKHGTQTIIGKIDYSQPWGTQFQVAMDYAPYPGILYGANPANNGCAGLTNNGAYVNTAGSVGLNQWYCAVATFDNGTMRFYVNGVLINTTNSGFAALNACPTATMQIGSWWSGDPQRFQGKIDDIRIYNRALNQQEIDALCPAQPCSDWLKVSNQLDGVKLGDLDISGNKITVEATFNRTASFTGGPLYSGNLVSKHIDPSICNYLLRPNSAEITTTDGYFAASAACDIQLNKTYHAALVYDGVSLKLYRNGYLMKQVPATGNLLLNNLITTIGEAAFASGPYSLPEHFVGFINEVRIWNVARTQAEIRTYMNTSLPSPTTQVGLQAYYVFSDLNNKQGNTLWNGTIQGGAMTRQTNIACAPVIDSCEKVVNVVPVVPSFSAPDTVCVNTPVNITNTTVGASSNYWNFCVGNLNNAPTGTNMGNISGNFTSPVYIDYVLDNGNYYGFATDNYTGNLLRLDFGTSLLNTPNVINYGNLGGVLPIGVEGLQIVKNEGKWYVIIVGGQAVRVTPFIIKVELGTNITNPTPVATNWGNLGNLAYPHDLYVFQDGTEWYGLTVNTENNTITRFAFSSSFSNVPIATNLGNVGNLSGPTGLHAINENGHWYAFVTNATSATICRLDFGNSLLNTPSGQNLGNVGNVFTTPWDISIIKFCGELLAFVLDAAGTKNSLVKLNLGNSITNNAPAVTSFGNIGNFDFPHCLSKIFRAGADLYSFVPNVRNSSLSRLQFAGCTNASIPNSTAQAPPPITYNTPGTYNINLTIDDGLPTQSAVCRQVVVMPAPVQSPTKSISICQLKTVRIGTPAKHVKYLWNTGATTDSIDINTPGKYWVDLDGFGCKAADTFLVTLGQVSEFGFKQDVCNPFSIQYTNVGAGTAAPWWDLGDGTIITGSLTVNHTYAGSANYKVRFSVSDGICTDTIEKIVPILVTKEDVVLTPDTIICDGTTKKLRAAQGLSYCWAPATFLDDPKSQTPTTNTTQDITYYLLTEVQGSNLVVNGNFSGGNAAFTSQYKYVNPNTSEGQYFVGTNPQTWNGSMTGCNDHTTGAGNMLLVNGSPVTDVIIWSQTVAVIPNMNYAFSTWIQALSSVNPASLQFSINGKVIGNQIAAPLPTCTWSQFYTTWNSGNNTSATIAIVNKNTQLPGNDFALDDISFASVLIKQDSVVIKVEKPIVKAVNDTTICNKTVAYLSATGANTYSWSPATGLSNTAVANPTATPDKPTAYTVTGTTVNGCVAKDVVTVDFFPKPTITKTPDTLVCRNASFLLHVAGGVSYEWMPAAGLQNIHSDRPNATVGVSDVTYHVTVKDANSCSNEDSVKINIRPYPQFKATGDKAICDGTTQLLQAANGDSYQWTPTEFVDDPGAASVVASPKATTPFSVYIKENTCGFDTTINILVTVNPNPTLQVEKSNDISCNVPSSQLRASGALKYEWYPVSGLDHPDRSNPIAAVETPAKYYVKGTNQFGCSSIDSIELDVTKVGLSKLVTANAFTPNGDNQNDCFGIKRWGAVVIEDFSIYNRWGQRVFHTKNPNDCWNGTVNGKPQDAGGYVYVIKAKTICGDIFQKGVVMLIR